MQVYFITRGVKHQSDLFITQLQGKYLKTKQKLAGDKEPKDYMVQVGVRPVQLWEVAFPKEHKDLMLTTLFGRGTCDILGNDGKKPCEHKWLKKLVGLLRVTLGLKKFPEYDKKEFLPLSKDNVQVIGIGVKDDYTTPDGCEGI